MRKRWVVGLLTASLVIGWAMPAFGAPSVGSLTRRITHLDTRENGHYEQLKAALLALDARVSATNTLLNLKALRTDVEHGVMSPSTGGFYSGRATCLAGYVLVGGGVTWLGLEYAGYKVISSGPDIGGTSWSATVNTGGSPDGSPQVYAVCARLS